MGYLRAQAAHFTTAILNPLSDRTPTEGDSDMIDSEKEAKGSPRVPDGPDTSSFTAFIHSLLSSEDKSSENAKDPDEQHVGLKEQASTSEIKENGGQKSPASTLASKENGGRKGQASASGSKETSGKKSLFSRGRHTLGRAIHKVAKVSGFMQSSENKSSCSTASDSSFSGHNSESLVTKSADTEFDLPPISETSSLLSNNLRAALYFSLPTLIRGRNWVLLYSTRRHGISLATLYRRSALCPGFALLVVGDQQGAVFGGLVESPLLPNNNRKYQGTNNSFVFTDLSSNPVIFWPTGSNRYYTLCSSDYMALGGGGHFALYLDEDLSNGTSSSSETFGNSCLAHSEEFLVKEVELWGFVYAAKYDEMLDLCRTEKPGICRW